MGAWAFGSTIVVGGVIFSVIGVILVRKFAHKRVLESHHEVAGYLLSIVGTLYAVLLGLVIVDVQSKYQQAKIVAEQEANSVADLYHLASAFKPELRVKMQTALREYVDITLTEWDGPRDQAVRSGSVKPLRAMWDCLTDLEPKSNREQACYGSMLTQIGQVADSRRFRVVTGRGSVSPVLWGVLIAGGILTVAFTYFFGVEDLKAHLLMTALVAATIALNVMLVALFSNPYKGDLRIQPEGFIYDQNMMKLLHLESNVGSTAEGQ